MHTRTAAYAAFDEPVRGSLRAGKRADLVLLSGLRVERAGYVLSEKPAGALTVEMTVVGGEIAWQSGQIA
jgi:predicted amidohydrolase YtcJ